IHRHVNFIMRWLHVILASVLGFGIVAGLTLFAGARHTPSPPAPPDASKAASAPNEGEEAAVLAEFPDPNAPGSSRTVFIGKLAFHNGVYKTAADFTGQIVNELSLKDLQQSILDRTPRGLSEWKGRADRLSLGHPPTKDQAI